MALERAAGLVCRLDVQIACLANGPAIGGQLLQRGRLTNAHGVPEATEHAAGGPAACILGVGQALERLVKAQIDGVCERGPRRVSLRLHIEHRAHQGFMLGR